MEGSETDPKGVPGERPGRRHASGRGEEEEVEQVEEDDSEAGDEDTSELAEKTRAELADLDDLDI